jgi:hypothetical protein
MRGMSSGEDRGPQSFARFLDLGAKIILPAAAALTLLAVVRDSARRIDRELQVTAPPTVGSPGVLPVRALLYVGLNRTEGAQLRAVPTTVALVSSSGAVLAGGRLKRSFAESMDGVFTIASGYAGEATLRVEARDGDERVRDERRVDIVPANQLGASVVSPRKLPPLQQLAPGPVTAVAGSVAPPPSALSLAIEGGACAPERPCDLWLHVGAPAAGIRVDPTASVSVESRPADLASETDGVVHLRVRTHGPEAELRVTALRAGAAVATRAFRLAVALGMDAMAELPAMPLASAQLAPALLGEESGGCIVDAFRAADHWQQWMGTGFLRECRGREALSFGTLEPGLWRVQLRRDPFGSDNAAVRALYVRAPLETTSAALTAIARDVRTIAPEDALARRVLEPDAVFDDAEPVARYLLARLDAGVASLPRPSSSLTIDLQRMAIERARLRKWALFAIALCALALGLLVAQRGLRAATQASQLMAAAGEDARGLDRQRLRMVLRVLGTVTSLLLAFAAIGVYMVARSHGLW